MVALLTGTVNGSVDRNPLDYRAQIDWGDGKQTTDFGGFDYAVAVAIRADGKIVVAGTTNTPPTCGPRSLPIRSP